MPAVADQAGRPVPGDRAAHRPAGTGCSSRAVPPPPVRSSTLNMDVARAISSLNEPSAADSRTRIIVANPDPGRLYVVATPDRQSGRSEPAGPRECCKACALVAAEDTRHTGRCCIISRVATPLVSLHEHNEDTARRGADCAAARRASGGAGQRCRNSGNQRSRICAGARGGGGRHRNLRGAGSVRGESRRCRSLRCRPRDSASRDSCRRAAAARRARLAGAAGGARTLVFYESPHRLAETLEDCAGCVRARRSACGRARADQDARVGVPRRAGRSCARARQEKDFTRGEIVLVVAGASPRPDAGRTANSIAC
jgi:16S rRNA (cytidine1402-2'-O)-methyltransferase